LISAGYPPDLDGIGDYTWWLAQMLAAQSEVEGPVRIFTALGPERTAAPGVEVFPFFDLSRPSSFANLLSSPAIEELDWLVLQYNPFSFGARGWCPSVPRTLARLRRLPGAPKIAVMFHETVVPKWPWKFGVMYCWQQPIFQMVCRAADVAFVSTERWTLHARRAAPHLRVHHLSVGSNITLSETSSTDARQRIRLEKDALVFGVFGSAHVSRRLDWIAATLAAASHQWPERRVVLLYVGAQGGMLHRACPYAEIIDAGRLPAEEVGCRLRAMDAVISPFLDGMSTRRTSVISVLHHGVPVATTRSAWTEELFLTDAPIGLLLSTARSAGEFAAETLDWIARLPRGAVPNPGVSAFYERHFTWSAIASKMVNHLNACDA
jgi:glycosyltransferase involved in cell wall biosynthesis